jgi:hypothetical protein
MMMIKLTRMKEPCYSSVRKGIAEAFNAADHLTGDFGAYPASCPMPAATAIQKIVMIDFACQQVTFFFIYC